MLTDKQRLEALIERETELRLEMDTLEEDIKRLELQLSGINHNVKEINDEIPIDLEEFHAPEWCVPIKANVMTFEWDVSN
jgi:mRNA (2'-O-methyladenosine-N6-)-methyltransferase